VSALLLYFVCADNLKLPDGVPGRHVALVLANLVNLAGNWLLVFGNLAHHMA